MQDHDHVSFRGARACRQMKTYSSMLISLREGMLECRDIHRFHLD